jgi:hypothetical protein
MVATCDALPHAVIPELYDRVSPEPTFATFNADENDVVPEAPPGQESVETLQILLRGDVERNFLSVSAGGDSIEPVIPQKPHFPPDSWFNHRAIPADWRGFMHELYHLGRTT